MPPKYKPGGRKFPPKSSSTPSTSSSTASASSPNVLDPEVEDQLEMELCWCIQQLQTALDSGKLSERQTVETNKTLNVLKSSTAPLIKKRQFMRTTFGDYRTKMTNDVKKLGKASAKVQFFTGNNSSSVNKKSIFLKKVASASDDVKPSENMEGKNFRIISTGSNDFRFNFHEPEK